MTLQRWEQPTTALGRDVVDGWADTLARVAELAEYIAPTEFVPKTYRDNPAAVAAAILAGRELGIGPMTALQHLYVVEGRPAMSAQLMRALVMAAGHTFRVAESTSARCTVVGRRAGETVDREPVTWSGDEVRRAGLAGRPMWNKYPRQMLLARATAELCRAVFPDVLGGMSYAVEEAADIPDDDDTEIPADPAPAKTVRRRRSTTPQRPATPPQIGSVADDAAGPVSRDPSSGTGPSHPLPPLPDDAGDRSESAPASSSSGEPADDGGAAADTAPTPDDDATEKVTDRQTGHLFALVGDLGLMHPRARRLTVVSALIGRNVESMAQLTRSEASALIDTLVRVKESPDGEEMLDALVAQGTARVVLGARVLDDDADQDDAPPMDQPALPGVP